MCTTEPPQSIMCMRHLGNVLYSRLIFCTTTKSKLISFCKQSRNCTEKEKTERERRRARMCSVAHSHIYSSIFYSIELLKCLRSREHLHIGPRCLKLQYICRILLCQSQYCRRVEWTGIFINECNKDSQFTVYNTWNCRIKTAINELMNRMLVRLCRRAIAFPLCCFFNGSNGVFGRYVFVYVFALVCVPTGNPLETICSHFFPCSDSFTPSSCTTLPLILSSLLCMFF